jgi:hypothetical protein
MPEIVRNRLAERRQVGVHQEIAGGTSAFQAMTFKKGISGNPGGKRNEKAFTDALRLVANREHGKTKQKKQKKQKKLIVLAEKLFDCALNDKQGWAFAMIADRLEGKAVQLIEASVNDNRSIEQYKDAELHQILRARLAAEELKKEGATLN